MAIAEKYWRMDTTLSLQRFKDRDDDLLRDYAEGANGPQKYLRFWGSDYLYLGSNRDSEPRWLPIPENSGAQKMIRDLHRKFQY